MIYIYTEDFFWPSQFKSVVKKLLGKGTRGPQAVLTSLLNGLDELGQEYCLNASIAGPIDTACVLSGHKVLAWAIEQKRAGKIKKLMAGPNVVVTPLDYNKLILAQEIDRYVVPAQWSVNWWVSLCPELRAKLALWPAGVADRGVRADTSGPMLIFQKNAPESVLGAVNRELEKRQLDFETLTYGKFSAAEYFKKLSHAPAMICLSGNESQGLALHEAWMANVPTLVWNPGVLEYKQFTWHDAKLAAPYMDDSCGVFFKDEIELPQALDTFLSELQNFKPREYSLKNFTNKTCAQNYTELLYSL